MARLDQPALFWLDGHHSVEITARGDRNTPLLDELRHILSAQEAGHVTIIDDAREFGVDPGYSTAEELTAFIRSMRPSARIDIKDDSVRITPWPGSPRPDLVAKPVRCGRLMLGPGGPDS